MRVLMAHRGFPSGGAGEAARADARAVAARGHRVLMAVAAAGTERPAREHDLDLDAGYETVALAVRGRSPWATWWNPRAARALSRLAVGFVPDVVHFHNVQRRSFSLAALLLARRYPSVWTLHDLWHTCVWSWPRPSSCVEYRRGCLWCARAPGLSLASRLVKSLLVRLAPLTVITPTQWLLSELARGPLAGAPARVARYGVTAPGDLARMPQAAARAEVARRHGIDLGESERVILFAGDLAEERKGWRALLALRPAIARLAGAPVRVVLAGGPARRGARPAPDAAVAAIGGVAPREMFALYRAADLLALPTGIDNAPRAIIEAALCGRPAVAFDVGGVRETLPDGWRRLVPPGDLGAFAAAAASLLSSPLTGAEEESLREFARARFSPALAGARLEEIYLSVSRGR
ncbi:MAG: glycosyltransferase [Planctomycetes bacterium]|nr:glycosyltransferase [Planctomycetota bacterium]